MSTHKIISTVTGNPVSTITLSQDQSFSDPTTGTIATVTQPNPTATVNQETGLVTATYTPVAGYVSETEAKSCTLQLEVQPSQTITPTTSSQTIASGKYLTGAQTISGDVNLTAENIAQGVSIFGVTGTHSGGTDVSDTTAIASDVLSGKYFYTASGVKTAGTGSGATSFYKCASVGSGTWTGYKAVFNTSTHFWSFEDTLTTGLTFGETITPIINSIYNNGCTIRAILSTGAVTLLSPHNMTANSQKGWTITAEVEESQGERYAWKIFNGGFGENDGWSGYPLESGWILIHRSVAFIPKELKLTRGEIGWYGSGGSIKISQSLDGTTYTEIYNGDNFSGEGTSYGSVTFDDNFNYCNYLKIEFTGVNNRLWIAEAEIYGIG